MRRLKIGILDILSLPGQGLMDNIYGLVLTKQYASIMPQSIAVWARNLGHEVHYATYYGMGDPDRILPKDLDFIFMAAYTQASPLAYLLSKLHTSRGVTTVIGGPHAKAFSADCARFFDFVIRECDEETIASVLKGEFSPGTIITGNRPTDVPTVEERLPEIRKASYLLGRPYFISSVPMLASIGCPYTCDFCIDFDNPYRLLSMDRFAEDVQFLSREMPKAIMAMHDPNFGIKFDPILDAIETVPQDQRNCYVMEASLSILREDRMDRLQDTNCVLVAPGVESWSSYSNKAGVGRETGFQKVEAVAEHFRRLHERVPYLQGNFIFGLDTDEGAEPIELTKEFMKRTPYVWPTLNIPVPFGGTPLYENLKKEGRILKTMPFMFYYAPYLTSVIKNYDPIAYYEQLVNLFEFCASDEMLKRRLQSARNWTVKTLHWVRTRSVRSAIKVYKKILDMLREDPGFRAFHEGRSDVLPSFYRSEYDRCLGHYSKLLTPSDRVPNLEHASETVVV